MRNLWLVAEFTIKDMLKRKSFIISTLIILIFIVVGFNIPNIMNKIGNDVMNEKILVIDSENLFLGKIEELNGIPDLEYNFTETVEDLSQEEINAKLEEFDACIKFYNGENDTIKMEYIVESDAMNFGTVSQTLISLFQNLYSNAQITKLNITPEQIAAMNPQFDVQVIETDENAASGNIAIMMIISAILFYAIIFCSQSVSTSVTTEKTSKIIETLVTSTDSKAIVLGKTIGIGIIGLIQIVLIITVSIISANLFTDKAVLESLFDLSNITPQFILITLIYFILGYMLYSLGYALVGATVSKPEDVQSANSPIALIAVAGFYLAYFSMMNPSSNINMLSGLIPISAPFSMPLRIMMGTATTSEILMSLILLCITTLLVASIAIKVYSSTILNTGAKLKLKDAIKMAKENKG